MFLSLRISIFFDPFWPDRCKKLERSSCPFSEKRNHSHQRPTETTSYRPKPVLLYLCGKVENMIHLAIVSPRQTATTETFIQAHRDIPATQIFFFYGGIEKAQLDGFGPLLDLSLGNRLRRKIGNPLSKFNFSPAQEAVAESFLTNKIDCILAEYGMTGAKILPIAQALNIPLIVHFHGFDATMHSIISELQPKYLKMFHGAAKIIAVSKVMKAKLIALGCPEPKINVNTYGANPLFLENKPTYEENHFVGLGRFVDKKAPYYTILAFQKVLEKFPNAHLTLAGDGNLFDACKNLVSYFKLESSISLPGIIAPNAFRALLSTCRAFVQHSITPSSGDMEGTPLAVLEASAAAIAVISTYHGGISDVVLHEQTGLLCEEHDIDAMAANMCLLIENPDLARKMGMKARQRITEKFTMERHLGALSKIIHEAVGQKPKSLI